MSTVPPEADAVVEARPGARERDNDALGTEPLALAAAPALSWQRGSAFLLLVLSLLALFRSEAAHVRDDLVLLAPEEALAGSRIPLRAFVLRDVEAVRGPVLGNARILVRLSSLAGALLSSGEAAGNPALGLRAELSVPANARGTLRVDAWEVPRGQGEGTPPERARLRVSRALTVVQKVNPRVLFRDALPLQRGAVGRVRAEGDQPPPAAFLPRVLGGVCVPEELCTLAVWLGEPAAALTLQPGTGVELVHDFPDSEGAGIVTATLRVHGPEAELSLRARRGRALVGARGMRLSVALGRALIGPLTLHGASHSVRAEVSLPPGRRRGVAELFFDDAWIASQDIDTARAQVAFSLPARAGMVRVQVRVDPFGAEGAAARVSYLGDDLPRALQAVGRERQGDATDGWARAFPGELAHDPALALAFAAAPGEEEALALATPVHARPVLTEQLNAGKLRVRWAAALALACGSLIAALSLVRRGLTATREASAVMAEAEWVDDSRTRRRAQLEVWLWALAVALAFAAAALLIVAKPLWF